MLKRVLKSISHGDTDGLRELLEEYPMVVNESNKRKVTPLICALDEGELQCADMLLKAKADVNVTDKEKRSPLLIAVVNAYDAMAARLIDMKADSSVVDDSGDSVLHHCVRNQLTSTLKRIIKRVSDKNVRNSIGLTPLLLAVANGSFDVTRILVEKGKFDVNVTDDVGDSSLHYAAKSGDVELLNFLCRNGGNMKLQNNSGATPLHTIFEHFGDAGGQQALKILPESRLDLTIRDNQGRVPSECVAKAKKEVVFGEEDEQQDNEHDEANTATTATTTTAKKKKSVAKVDSEFREFLEANSLMHLESAFARKKLTLDDLMDIVELHKLKKLNIGNHADAEAIRNGVKELQEVRREQEFAEAAAAEFDELQKRNKLKNTRIFMCSALVGLCAIFYVVLQVYVAQTTTTTND